MLVKTDPRTNELYIAENIASQAAFGERSVVIFVFIFYPIMDEYVYKLQ